MKKIAIICEDESPTSRIIVKRVSTIIHKLGYHAELISVGQKTWRTLNDNLIVDKNDFSIYRQNQKIKFDCAYIYGEGEITKGWIQGYLSLLAIPYLSYSPLTTLIATNKYFCKEFLKSIHVPMAKGIKISTTNNINIIEVIEEIGFPCIIKPNIGTDSYLIEKAHTFDDLEKGIDNIIKIGQEALIEEFIDGREMTCGIIYNGETFLPTPLTEIIIPNDEFYSYDVKLKRRNKKLTPAPLSNELTKRCQDLTLKIYQALECEGFIRIDYILKDSTFYFLEVNITPGLSPRSNLPLQIEAMGRNLETLFADMIDIELNV